MWDERASESRRTVKFYIRRFFRIAPLYWFALVLYFFIGYFSGFKSTGSQLNPSSTQVIVLTLTFLHGFFPTAINSAVPGGWTIAIEMGFYALFPLLMSFNLKPVYMLLFGFVYYLLIGVIGSGLLEHFFQLPPLFIYYSQLTQFPIFPIGICIYMLSFRRQLDNEFWVLAQIVLWIVFSFSAHYLLKIETRPFFWTPIFIFAATLYLFVRRKISLPFFSELGTLSYSMYLFHFAIIFLFDRFIPLEWRGNAVAFAAFFFFILMISALVGKLSRATFERWSSIVAKKLVARIG